MMPDTKFWPTWMFEGGCSSFSTVACAMKIGSMKDTLGNVPFCASVMNSWTGKVIDGTWFLT